MKIICEHCFTTFKSKKELKKHLEEVILQANEEADECNYILDNL